MRPASKTLGRDMISMQYSRKKNSALYCAELSKDFTFVNVVFFIKTSNEIAIVTFSYAELIFFRFLIHE